MQEGRSLAAFLFLIFFGCCPKMLLADSLWISSFPGSGAITAPYTNGTNFYEFDTGYKTSFADWSLRYRPFISVFSGDYMLFLEGEKAWWPTANGFTFNYILGFSDTSGAGNVLAMQGGLSALLQLNGDFDLYSRWDNTFYSDSDLAYIETDLHWNHFLIKPLTIFVAWEVFADIPYQLNTVAFYTVGHPGLKLEFDL